MSLQREFLALAVLCAIVGSCTSSTPEYRLPGDVLPKDYDLRILTNIADLNSNYTFSGDVAIQVEPVTATKKIVLHSRDLHIDENSVKVLVAANNASGEVCRSHDNSSSLASIAVNQHTYNENLDYYMIHLNEELKPNTKYLLCIPFQGELNPGLAGYYRSSYNDQTTGQTKWLGVTQFESTDARRAFPCFDEPGMKAPFTVTLGHIKTKSAISNMPLVESKPIAEMDGWVWDKFEKTVPMSTYLLAFMVSEMEYQKSPPTKNNVEFRVWARKDALSQVKYAAEIGPKILEDYENYFNIKYPLPKQDMVAVPDFNAGAMENWGLITYRETALLSDPKFTSATDQPHVVNVIAHEIAHQWFGNLVTMKWWTDLWLNEGFATYMASQEVHKLYPEWNSLDESVVKIMSIVSDLDSLKSSHPISVPIGHPKEIAQIFDKISYSKGSYILRMINTFLGEETFRKGVSNYLRKHAYGNAEQDDLWAALTAAAHTDNILPTNMSVKEIMDTWTLQTGYPIITVTRDYKTGLTTVHQERYLVERLPESPKDNTTWWVPLTYTTATESNFNSTSPRVWLPANQTNITIANLPTDDWLIFNIQLASLYRVNYDEENWRRLVAVLDSDKFEDIHVMNRVQLIQNSLELAWSGDLQYSVPFRLLQYVRREKQYLPWRAAIGGLRQLNGLLKRSTLYGAFKVYSKSLIAPIYNTTSNEEIEDIPKNLQKIKFKNLVASWACELNIADCRSRAVHLFRKWMATPNPDEQNPVPKNVRPNVYCYAIQEGGEDEWDFAWRRYLLSNVAAHRSTILSALSCTREAWLLNRYLQWGINETSGIRRQDSRTVFLGVSGNELGYFLAKDFFIQNIEAIYKHHGAKTSKLSSYVSSLTSEVTSQAELDEYIALTKKNEKYLEGATQSVNQALENAKVNVLWKQKFLPVLSKMLVDPTENMIGNHI